MTKRDNDTKQAVEEHDLDDQAEELIEELTDEEGHIDEELVEEISWEELSDNEQINSLKESLLRQQADYENFKRRTERDKDEMVFFIKSKIINPILKRVDDIERIIKNTPEVEKEVAAFTAILVLEKALKKDLEDMWVKEFTSKWEEVDPNKHDVMTQVPWEEGIIIDEFEKGYLIDDKVLRVAKVVVWLGE